MRALLVMLFALLATTAALASARIVRLSYTEGTVQMDRNDDRGFKSAFLNMPVIQGARLQTAEDGRAEVEFENGSTMRLTPETQVSFRELGLNGNGERVTFLEMDNGTAYFDVRKHDAQDFRLVLRQQQITLRKPARFRVELGPADLKLSVYKGDVELLQPNGQRVEVRKNETVLVQANDTDRYYLAGGISDGPFDYWDKQREEERDQYQYSQTYGSGYNIYNVSNVYYGMPELYRWGNFFYVGGYGWMWRPTYAYGIGWDPFFDGEWVWYPGSGYVWVSPYPWGWTPYRYGSWHFINGRGWCWRPPVAGNFVATNWHPAPSTVGGPTSFRNPRPPVERTSDVVLVGRGPEATREVRETRDNNNRGNRAVAGSASGGGSVTSGGTSSSGSAVMTRDSRGDVPNAGTGRAPRVITNEDLERGRPAGETAGTNSGSAASSGQTTTRVTREHPAPAPGDSAATDTTTRGTRDTVAPSPTVGDTSNINSGRVERITPPPAAPPVVIREAPRPAPMPSRIDRGENERPARTMPSTPPPNPAPRMMPSSPPAPRAMPSSPPPSAPRSAPSSDRGSREPHR